MRLVASKGNPLLYTGQERPKGMQWHKHHVNMLVKIAWFMDL